MSSTKENNNHSNASLIWWQKLSPIKKELFEAKYDKIDEDKINKIYLLHTDNCNNEDED